VQALRLGNSNGIGGALRAGAALAEGSRDVESRRSGLYIDGTEEEGTVKEVHSHEAIVRVKIPGEHEDRQYAHESLRLDPTMKEASNV
jgi:hypothetical protein